MTAPTPPVPTLPAIPDWQARVHTEKQELDEKATKLSTFIGTSEGFASLVVEEQLLLREQAEIMWEYSEVLGKRIARF